MVTLCNSYQQESYVAVPPPMKKRRLLTEHQKEKMREKRDIPTLYNALDPSQDSMQPPLTEDQSLTDRFVCICVWGGWGGSL